MSTFKNISEMVKAVYLEATKGIKDERLLTLKAPTGLNEGTNADGGYLVNADILGPILNSVEQGSVLWSKATKFQTSKYGAKIPFVTETTRTHEGAGALNSYWIGEAIEKEADTPAFGKLDLKLHKLVVIMPVTDELMQDSALLDSFCNTFVPKRMAWEIDRAILQGNGNTQMYGIMSADTNGTIGVATADPLTEAIMENFDKALAPASAANSEYYVSKENYNDLTDIDWTNDNAVTYEDGHMYVLGHKVNVMEQMTSPYNLMLGDVSQYLVLTKGGVETAVNISLRYDYDESTIRWILRVNGKSYGQAYTLEDGTQVATFVIPEDTPAQESSSSSSMDSSSSSSSSNSSASSSSSSSVDSSSSSSSSNSSASSSSSSSNSSASSASSESTDVSDSSNSSSSSVDSSSSSSSSSSLDSSDSSSSSSIDSSSESSMELCDRYYCAEQFVTPGYNGEYEYTGVQHDGYPVYYNDVYYIWFDATANYWVMGKDVGDPSPQWFSSRDLPGECPAGDWVNEDGFLTEGVCSEQ